MLQRNVKSLITGIMAALALTACASNPEPDPQRGDGTVRSGAAFSGMAARPVALLFVSMDANNDSVLDTSELDAGISSGWATLSASGSDVGAIQYNAWSEKNLGAADALPGFMTFDRDLNRKMTPEEFDEGMRAQFTQLDANKDGQLERSELLFAIRRGGGRQQRQQGQQGRRQPGQGQGRGRGRRRQP